jgi:MFS family permease
VTLWLLYAAQFASRTGNVVTTIAVPFAVLSGGGSAADVGIAAFAATVPIVLGGPFGGVLVERFGMVRSSVVSDAVSAAALLAIAVLHWTVGLSFPALLVLVFVGGLLDQPGESARRVLVPGLARAAGMPLERAVGNMEACVRLASLVGAPVGGVLVATLGAVPSLAVTAVAFSVAALVTGLFVRPAPTAPVGSDGPDPATEPTSRGYWADLAEGFRFCVRDPLFRLVIALVVVTNMLDAARSQTLLPLYADRELGGSTALGVIAGVFGGGAFVGSVVFGYIAHRMPRRLTFAVCFVIAGGPSLIAPALGAPLPWMIVSAAVSGLAAGSLNPILGAVELERIPEHMRARVFGLLGAGSWAGIPIGGLLAGVAAQHVGVHVSFAAIAVVYTVATLSPLLGGSWRLMERPTAASERGADAAAVVAEPRVSG